MGNIILVKDLGMIYATEKSKQKVRFGLFLCFCGREFRASLHSVQGGKSKSCGCSKGESHRLSKHPLYKVLEGIKKRIYNKKEENYKYYGGRGIKLCNEWETTPSSFIEWGMNNGYKKGLQIDRKDNNGDYTPSNCRFVTVKVNANNRGIRSDNRSGIPGIFITKHNTYRTCKSGIKSKTFKTQEEAIKYIESGGI